MMALQTFPYTIISTDQHFEVRRMKDYFVVKANVEESRGYVGFDACFRYISGENEASQRFAMTTPVLNKMEGVKMKDTPFVLLNQDHFPQPQGNATIEKVNSSLMVIIKFSGSVSDQLLSKKQAQLRAYIESNGYTIKDGPWLARYNPPFIPGFLKRNELMMEVYDD